MDYYTQELYIPQVDKSDTIIGKVERWEAHRKGILHRGFTVALLYNDAVVCQHRKHPVFDGFLDLTASSHPFVIDDVPQDTITAVENCLKREWGVAKTELVSPLTLKGKVIYKSIHGEYTEHEVCHLYIASVSQLPVFNPEFAYGWSLIPIVQLNTWSKPDANPVLNGLAPWVTPMLDEGLLAKM